jgi:hypothetical protein
MRGSDVWLGFENESEAREKICYFLMISAPTLIPFTNLYLLTPKST